MSRLKSARGAKPAKPAKAAKTAARGAAGGRGVYVASPKSDIYVALLGIALGALLLGSLLLILVLNKYEFKTKAAALAPAIYELVA